MCHIIAVRCVLTTCACPGASKTFERVPPCTGDTPSGILTNNDITNGCTAGTTASMRIVIISGEPAKSNDLIF